MTIGKDRKKIIRDIKNKTGQAPDVTYKDYPIGNKMITFVYANSVSDASSINDFILRRLDEILEKYPVDTIVVGMPYNMDGSKTVRAEVTEKFIHKLKCKYNKIKIETLDERLTTVAAHKTMNFLDVNKTKKRGIVDTISAVYILEMYMNKSK